MNLQKCLESILVTQFLVWKVSQKFIHWEKKTKLGFLMGIINSPSMIQIFRPNSTLGSARYSQLSHRTKIRPVSVFKQKNFTGEKNGNGNSDGNLVHRDVCSHIPDVQTSGDNNNGTHTSFQQQIPYRNLNRNSKLWAGSTDQEYHKHTIIRFQPHRSFEVVHRGSSLL